MGWNIESFRREIMERLNILRHGRSDSGEPDSLVGEPLRPRPHFNSGAIALDLQLTDTTDVAQPRQQDDARRSSIVQQLSKFTLEEKSGARQTRDCL